MSENKDTKKETVIPPIKKPEEVKKEVVKPSFVTVAGSLKNVPLAKSPKEKIVLKTVAGSFK